MIRYDYDLNNPIEREMFIEKQKNQWNRVNNKELSLQQGFIEVMKEQQKEMEYFQYRDRIEKELSKQVEEKTVEVIETVLNNLQININ